MSELRLTPKTSLLALALAVTAAAAGCGDKGGYGGGKKSPMMKWLESPRNGTVEGNFIKIPSLGVSQEIPETRYVFKNCHEPVHSPEGDEKWVPVIRCSSTPPESGDDFSQGGSGDSDAIALTFYLAKKDRPIDERAVAYFRNELSEKGYTVEDISFNDSYFDKKGLYFKLQLVDENGTPTREIVRFMFPYEDVVFIANMDYPFGDSRSVHRDWESIMWYFKFTPPAVGK
ncbi:MAG TPA: hypothetical protein PKW35_08535 [Nannocystaceae bacterium]|nr:hypothetical protein [Nannocystaceae bacterium]